MINIITKSGKYTEKPLKATVSISVGSWNTLENSVAVYGKRNQWDYNLSGSYNESDGYRHTDPKRKVFGGQIGYEFDKGVRLEADINRSDYSYKNFIGMKKWQLDEYRKDIRNIRNKQTGATYNYRPNESSKEILNGGLNFSYDKNDWLFNSSFSMSRLDNIYENLKDYNSSTKKKNCYKYDKDDDRTDFKVSGGRTFSDEGKIINTITLGYDFSKDTFGQTKSYPYATTGKETAIKKGTIDCEKDIYSLFVNNELKYDRWGLLTGLRYDIAEYNVENKVPQSVEKEFKELGWDITPSYSFTPNNNLFLSVNKSCWYPASAYIKTALEKDHPDNQPEDLGPEEDLTYEVGFKHRLMEAFNYSISLFRTMTEHKYMSYYDDTGTFQGWKPVGDSIHKGIEAEVDGRPLEWFGYRLAFSWLDAEWDKGRAKARVWGTTPAGDTYEIVDISGKKLYGVPEYTYSVGSDFYPLDNWQFSVTLNGVGEQYADVLERYKEDAYSTVDAKLSYTLNNWKFYLAGSNLFDEESEKLYNATGKRDTDGTPSHSYYPRDGRYFGIGATVKF